MVKYGIGELDVTPLTTNELHENPRSKFHALLNGINGFVLKFPHFFADLGNIRYCRSNPLRVS